MNVARNVHTRRHGRQLTSHRSFMEALEGRTLLAGNVITTPTGTPNSPGQPAQFLTIDGDQFANEIMVRKGTAPGEIIVNGLNGTLVNGSTQEWHFNGVQALQAAMGGGNDKFDARNLSLSGVPDSSGVAFAQVIVDGGNGDDRITFFNTTIDASAPPPAPLIFPSSSVGVLLFGESSAFGPPSGTGNDFIEVSNTTIIAAGGESSGSSLIIYGEQNSGGTITGGNDHINVSNTVIRATSTAFESGASAAVVIYGDSNEAGFTAPTSVIGQGNDWIDVNQTDIIANSAQGSGSVFVQVIGDSNQAFGTGTATIGNFGAKTGGDDTINLTNMTVSASGANFSQNSIFMDIEGDQNIAHDATATATVGNGNDTITVDNFDVNANGTMSDNSAALGIFGDGDYASVPANFGHIGRGNDVIYVQNTDVTGTGTLNNAATLELYSDDRTQSGEAGTTVGEGTDNVQLSSFLLHADAGGGSSAANVQMHTQKGNDVVDVLNIDVSFLGMSTGTGNDDVDVLNSEMVTGNWDLEGGNDLLKVNGCTFVLITANGGTGIDTLQAHGNTGVLVPVGFEIINMS